ncbi:MAG: SemiSWEET transporter [Candidatus Omnitrophica bacterium]|nr:SemiSWEET transporter [Candidatus Omnitrophota bacterium]
MISFLIGTLAGVLCTLSFLPQVLKVFKTKKVEDLSLVTFVLFALGVFLWLVYGLIIKELPIILANIATLILVLLIVLMKLKYRQ